MEASKYIINLKIKKISSSEVEVEVREGEKFRFCVWSVLYYLNNFSLCMYVYIYVAWWLFQNKHFFKRTKIMGVYTTCMWMWISIIYGREKNRTVAWEKAGSTIVSSREKLSTTKMAYSWDYICIISFLLIVFHLECATRHWAF